MFTNWLELKYEGDEPEEQEEQKLNKTTNTKRQNLLNEIQQRNFLKQDRSAQDQEAIRKEKKLQRLGFLNKLEKIEEEEDDGHTIREIYGKINLGAKMDKFQLGGLKIEKVSGGLRLADIPILGEEERKARTIMLYHRHKKTQNISQIKEMSKSKSPKRLQQIDRKENPKEKKN